MTLISPRALMLSTAIGLCAFATPAMAEGTRVVLQSWNPAAERPDGLQTLVDRREGLETMVRAAWDAARGKACDEIKAQIPTEITGKGPDASLPKSEIICDIGPANTVVMTDAGQRLTVTIVAPTNSLRVKAVYKWPVPDAFVTMPFSLTGTINARSGVPGRLLTLDSASVTAKTKDPQIVGASAAANIALALADLFNVNIAALIKKNVGDRKVELGQGVDAFNDAMTRVSPDAIARAASVRMWRGGGITLFSLTPNFPPMPPGPISGAVVARAGMPDCGGIAVTAMARAPGTLLRPFSNPPTFKDGPLIMSSVAKSIGGQSQVPNQGVASDRRCAYRIADAPAGSASKVSAVGYGTTPTGDVASLEPSEQLARVSASNVNFSTVWGRSPFVVRREIEGKINVRHRDFATPGAARPSTGNATPAIRDRVRTQRDNIALPQAGAPVVRTAPAENRAPRL